MMSQQGRYQLDRFFSILNNILGKIEINSTFSLASENLNGKPLDFDFTKTVFSYILQLVPNELHSIFFLFDHLIHYSISEVCIEKGILWIAINGIYFTTNCTLHMMKE
jgi:hypothetical protein